MKVRRRGSFRPLLTGALLLLSFPAQTPAQRPDGSVVGIPWTGERGVVETTAQIMARETYNRELALLHPGADRRAHLPPHRLPDRRNLPQNPKSPHDPPEPPAPGGEERHAYADRN